MEFQPEVLQKISQRYGHMSRSQQMIADVILRDPETSAFYNVNQLAKQADASDSTVTRFAIFVGYSGYPALSQELQALVRSRLTTGQRFQYSQKLENDKLRSVLQCFEDDLQNIRMMAESIDLRVFEQVVEKLMGPGRTGLICSRSTVALGLFFEFYMNQLNKEVILLSGDPKTIDLLHRFGPGDVVFGIGFARYSRITVQSLEYAKKKGAHIIALTDYPSSPLCGFADHVLFTPTGIASHMDSFAAPFSLITALLRAMAQTSPQQVSDRLNELETLWDQFDIYV